METECSQEWGGIMGEGFRFHHGGGESFEGIRLEQHLTITERKASREGWHVELQDMFLCGHVCGFL